MQLSLLHTFLDLIETRNFNRTAERLELTQSTVSNRIRVLEKEVGARLFDRGRGGAEPTAAGQIFAGHARELIASWTHALRDVGVHKDHERVLRVAAQLSLQSTVLVSFARAFRAANPAFAVDLQSDYSEQIMRNVTTGHTDIGILLSPQLQPDLRVTHIGELSFHMLSNHADALAEVAVSAYCKVDYTAAFSRTHDKALPWLSASGITVGNERLASELFKHQKTSAYMPSHIARAKGALGLMIVRDAPVISLPLYTAVHRNKRADHMIQTALKVLVSMIGDQRS